MKEKIAVLGGSFNPIHNGHLMLGIEARRQYQVDRVLVMPNRDTYYKNNLCLAGAKERSDMVKLAISDYPYMEYSDLELQRTGITYTYDTIRQLKELYPSAELYFIIGGDSLEHLGQWYRIQELIYMTHFLAAGRADVDASKAAMLIQAYEEQYPGCKIHFLQTEAMDISSSALREMAARREAIDAFVPTQVADYIREQQLYISMEE